MPNLPSDVSPEDYNQAVRAYLKDPSSPAQRPASKPSSALSENAPGLLGMLGAGVAGKALAAAKPILGAIIGPNAKNPWRLATEHRARTMLSAGESPEAIASNTGLYLGRSGAYKRYVPDVGFEAKPLPFVKQGEPLTLPMKDVVKWPEMFNQYPHMKEMPVDMTNRPWESGGTYWGDRIQLDGPIGGDRLSWPRLRSLAHEGQHGIADYEGWPIGSNPSFMTSRAKGALDDRNRVGYQAYGPSQPHMESLFQQYGLAPENVGRQMYLRHPGEVESRLTETLLAKLKGQPLEYNPEVYEFNDASKLLNKRGIGLQMRGGGMAPEYKWSLYNLGSGKAIDPDTLHPSDRQIWDFLPHENVYGTQTLGRVSDPDVQFPWKWEDYPRSKQLDYENPHNKPFDY